MKIRNSDLVWTTIHQHLVVELYQKKMRFWFYDFPWQYPSLMRPLGLIKIHSDLLRMGFIQNYWETIWKFPTYSIRWCCLSSQNQPASEFVQTTHWCQRVTKAQQLARILRCHLPIAMHLLLHLSGSLLSNYGTHPVKMLPCSRFFTKSIEEKMVGF